MISTIDMDLAQDETPSPPSDKTWILVRWRGKALGELVVDRLQNDATVESIVMNRFAPSIEALDRLRSTPPQPSPVRPDDVSVVVLPGTSHALRRKCLSTIEQLDPPPGEVLILDRDEDAAGGASGPGPGWITHLLEVGWRRAEGKVVTYMSDRCRPDRGSIGGLAEAFGESSIAAVTGLILPAALETGCQFRFDRAFLNRRSYERRLWARSIGGGRGVTGFHPGIAGGISYRRAALADTGGFAAGTDSVSPGVAEYRVLAKLLDMGHVLSRDPNLVIWHEHPASTAELHEWIRQTTRDRMSYLIGSGIPMRRALAHELKRRFAGMARSLVRDRTLDLLANLSGIAAGFLMAAQAGTSSRT